MRLRLGLAEQLDGSTVPPQTVSGIVATNHQSLLAKWIGFLEISGLDYHLISRALANAFIACQPALVMHEKISNYVTDECFQLAAHTIIEAAGGLPSHLKSLTRGSDDDTSYAGVKSNGGATVRMFAEFLRMLLSNIAAEAQYNDIPLPDFLQIWRSRILLTNARRILRTAGMKYILHHR